MRLGLGLALACAGGFGSFSAFAASSPEVSSVAFSLEGRVVWCRGEKDEDTKGFQFKDWIVHVNNSQPTPYIAIHFRPRFLKCLRAATGLYLWSENAEYRKENRLAAGFYEPAWLGSERIQFMDQAEFPDLNTFEDRLYLRYPLSTFFTEKEWKRLRETKKLVKRAILFPWPKDRWDTPQRGVPGEILMYGSWYELTATFEMRADATIHVSEFAAPYTSRGTIKEEAESSPK
jgi:hypothetical protein